MSYQEVITLWAGLSVDLIIEQVLMTSMKTSDGLTRGHGMTDQQLVKWLLTMADWADVNHAILQLTGVNYNTGVQNKDMADARQALDMKDTHIILNYLLVKKNFCPDPSLCSVSSGVHGHITVNVDKAKTIRNTILAKIDGQTTAEYTLKKDQTITLSTPILSEYWW